MAKYDARDSKSLKAAWEDLGETQSLREFLEAVKLEKPLEPAEQKQIVDQALLIIEDLFAHLPLKEARHAVNPVQRLRLLRQRLADMNDTAFHSEMIEIFKGLRDAHTNYGLPRPYAGKYACLPFLMEEFYDGGEQRRFLVTRLLHGFRHPRFNKNVEVTRWNGMPVEHAVGMNANREEGSNSAARFAFGLSAMTIRHLGNSLPPEEAWVTITFEYKTQSDEIQSDEIILPWRVWRGSDEPESDLFDSPEEPGGQRLSLSLCSRVRHLNLARKHLFAPHAILDDRRCEATRELLRDATKQGSDQSLAEICTTDTDWSKKSTLPTVLDFKVPAYGGKKFGYIRIRRFDHPDVDEFLEEFRRILELMPRNGLILDVRGNGGGYVLNGERLLQLFTPKEIEPEPFQFISTELTREICSEANGLTLVAARRRKALADRWGRSLQQSIQTGAQYSNGYPLTKPEEANSLGQLYHGPVVLITDALCYSTTDLFAAGFQDHKIGKIIGVDANTGAGGAEVWNHRNLVSLLPKSSRLEHLPTGTTMHVAIRRSLRVGPNTGQPLEDLGVRPDERYRMTRSDLMDNNKDLINHACGILDKLPSRQLDIEVTAVGTDKISLKATTRNLDRLDFIVDNRPVRSDDVTDGTHSREVASPHRPRLLEVNGYKKGELLAGRKIELG